MCSYSKKINKRFIKINELLREAVLMNNFTWQLIICTYFTFLLINTQNWNYAISQVPYNALVLIVLA